MSYFVTKCTSCARVCLAAKQLVTDKAVACSAGGSPAEIVPSSLYSDADAPLFEELSQTLREGGISPLEAARLSSELSRALSNKSYDQFFDLLSTRTPGFTPIQLVFGGRPSAQLRALGMLATILDALALSARSSTIPAVTRPSSGVHEG